MKAADLTGDRTELSAGRKAALLKRKVVAMIGLVSVMKKSIGCDFTFKEAELMRGPKGKENAQRKCPATILPAHYYADNYRLCR